MNRGSGCPLNSLPPIAFLLCRSPVFLVCLMPAPNRAAPRHRLNLFRPLKRSDARTLLRTLYFLCGCFLCLDFYARFRITLCHITAHRSRSLPLTFHHHHTASRSRLCVGLSRRVQVATLLVGLPVGTPRFSTNVPHRSLYYHCHQVTPGAADYLLPLAVSCTTNTHLPAAFSHLPTTSVCFSFHRLSVYHFCWFAAQVLLALYKDVLVRAGRCAL